MIKNDKWILQQCSRGMISPYEPTLVRRYKRDSDELACVSYGIYLENDNNQNITYFLLLSRFE